MVIWMRRPLPGSEPAYGGFPDAKPTLAVASHSGKQCRARPRPGAYEHVEAILEPQAISIVDPSLLL